MRVQIPLDEFDRIRWIAEQRRTVAASRGFVAHGRPGDVHLDQIGVKGELAFHLASGLPWIGENRLGSTDFPGIEIKTKDLDNRPGGDLIVKAWYVEPGPKRQPSATIYVLTETSIDAPWVDLIGWVTVGEIAAHPETRRLDIGGQAIAFPRKYLRPIGTLPCLTR